MAASPFRSARAGYSLLTFSSRIIRFYSPLKMVAGCTRRNMEMGRIADTIASRTLPATMTGSTENRGDTEA